jgi:Fur family ferric uptake transcriptional regulator
VIEPALLLREAGLRVTQPRLAVLDVLAAQPHLDAEAVSGHVARTGFPLSVQSVHNVLRDLTTAGVLRRIEPADSAALYETRVGDNHHHVVCRGCGAVADVECAVGHAPCLHPPDAAGFRIDLAEVVYWGWCSDCIAQGIAERSASPNSVITESPRRNPS